ncbi:hypothetical protein CcI6DRAFT_04563 [Frankia sp. CcI6]|nr:hypothetical protein CcI6DRAFT_04563 [Frankia sp. CcI6]
MRPRVGDRCQASPFLAMRQRCGLSLAFRHPIWPGLVPTASDLASCRLAREPNGVGVGLSARKGPDRMTAGGLAHDTAHGPASGQSLPVGQIDCRLAIVVGATPWRNTAVTPTLVSSAGARERGAVEEVFGSVRLAGRIVHVDDGRLRRGGPHEWRTQREPADGPRVRAESAPSRRRPSGEWRRHPTPTMSAAPVTRVRQFTRRPATDRSSAGPCIPKVTERPCRLCLRAALRCASRTEHAQPAGRVLPEARWGCPSQTNSAAKGECPGHPGHGPLSNPAVRIR